MERMKTADRAARFCLFVAFFMIAAFVTNGVRAENLENAERFADDFVRELKERLADETPGGLAVLAIRDARGGENALTNLFRDLLTARLVRSGAFAVIEREHFERVLDALMVSESDLVENKGLEKVRLGKIQPVRYGIVGTLQKTGDDYKASLRTVNCETGVNVRGCARTGTIPGDAEMDELWGKRDEVIVSVYPTGSRAQAFLDDAPMRAAGENLFRASAPEGGDGVVRVVAEGFEERRTRVSPSGGKPESIEVRLTAPMRLEFWLEDAENGAIIGNSGVVQSWRNYRFLLRTNRDAYVYIFNIGTSGKIVPLAPNPEVLQSNFVRAEELVRIPEQKAFQIDDKVGVEKIVAVASPVPLRDCQELGEALVQNTAYRLDRSFDEIVASLEKKYVTKDFIATPVEPARSGSVTLNDGDGAVMEFTYVHR